MSDFASNLKSLAVKTPYTWLADSRLGNPETYQQLAKPESMVALKEANIGHLYLDLPNNIGFISDRYNEGKLKAEDLVKEVTESPSYTIYAGRNKPPVSAATIAELMFNAKQNGVELHFTANSMLEPIDGSRMKNTIEAEFIRHSVNTPVSAMNVLGGLFGQSKQREEFARQELAKPESVLAKTQADLIAGHRQLIEDTASEVGMLPQGERALIILQGNLPIEQNVQNLLGADKVSRAEPENLFGAAQAEPVKLSASTNLRSVRPTP